MYYRVACKLLQLTLCGKVQHGVVGGQRLIGYLILQQRSSSLSQLTNPWAICHRGKAPNSQVKIGCVQLIFMQGKPSCNQAPAAPGLSNSGHVGHFWLPGAPQCMPRASMCMWVVQGSATAMHVAHMALKTIVGRFWAKVIIVKKAGLRFSSDWLEML